MQEVTLVELKAQPVLGMRRRGAYALIPQFIKEVCEYAIGNGIAILAPPMFICHELSEAEAVKAMAENNADVEVAVPVAAGTAGSGDIKSYELAGGTAAKVVHKGPYEDCKQAYDRLFAWLAANGKPITAPIREVYLNDPRTVAPPEILTEIYAPVD